MFEAIVWFFVMLCTIFASAVYLIGMTQLLYERRRHLDSFKSVLRTTLLVDPPMMLHALPVSLDGASFYLERMELRNIRCYPELTVDFTGSKGVSLATLVVGDNATGKSTVLRALALGLCPESEAVGLIKRLPGSLLRNGETEGSISVMLRSGKDHATITTRIENVNGQERVRQTTSPLKFPWDDLFMCAYGTSRTTEAAVSYESYSRQFAVETLFSDSAKLMNPEVVMLRRDEDSRKALERVVLAILMLDDWKIQQSKRGLELTGPSGSQLLNSVSDGYRNTTQWILDYLGWQLLAGRFSATRTAGGILLIDEIEQHLHPRWQRYILHRIREQFPLTQLIVTTHTPLVVAGAADVEGAQLLSLVKNEQERIEIEDIPREALRGRRADEILSGVFGLWTTKSPGSAEVIDRYSAILSKPERTEADEQELTRLRDQLHQTDQTHRLSQQVEDAVAKVLDEMAKSATDRISMEPEVRRQLEEYSKGDGAP